MKITDLPSNFMKMFEAAKIDLTQDIPYPPNVLSIGEHAYGQTTYPTTFGTEGNFSCISGAAKSRKSFFKALLVASYIAGDTYKFAPNIKSHRTTDKVILDFDTEQSTFHALRSFKKVQAMVGASYKNYYPFSLRQFSKAERLDFIDKCISYEKNLGLVIIDGIVDLCLDFNDQKSCDLVVGKLLEWTDKTQCHIIVIIHTNQDTSKARGHLGTFIQQKAETVTFLTKEETLTKVHVKETRGYPIDDFWFAIDNDGLPYVKENNNKLMY